MVLPLRPVAGQTHKNTSHFRVDQRPDLHHVCSQAPHSPVPSLVPRSLPRTSLAPTLPHTSLSPSYLTRSHAPHSLPRTSLAPTLPHTSLSPTHLAGSHARSAAVSPTTHSITPPLTKASASRTAVRRTLTLPPPDALPRHGRRRLGRPSARRVAMPAAAPRGRGAHDRVRPADRHLRRHRHRATHPRDPAGVPPARVQHHVEDKVVQTSASWLLMASLSARSCSKLCPKLRPATANQPLGRLWPTISALFSTQAQREQLLLQGQLP